MKYSKKTFCAYPFTYISTTNSGEYRACCESLGSGISAIDTPGKEAWNSDFYKQLRLDLINGRFPNHCSTCWKNESQGAMSSRQKELYNYTEEDIQQILSSTNSDGSVDIKPIIFEFKVGNLCNLRCIMCTQMESSGHESEIKTLRSNNEQLPELLEYIENKVKDNRQVYRYSIHDQQALLNNLFYFVDSIQQLMIVGGEPFKNPITYDILDSLIQQGYHKQINLIIISNFYEIDFNCVDLASKFKNCLVNISIDHIDPIKFNYIRYPAEYYKVYEKLHQYLSFGNIKVSISFTLSIFNALDIKEIFYEFFRWNKKSDKGIEVQFNHVTFPKYFNPRYLSNDCKEKVLLDINFLLSDKDIIEWIEVNNLRDQFLKIIDYIDTVPDDYDQVIHEQKRVLNLYDKYRHTKHKDLFNHLA